jgi:hypothetical protein
MVAAAEARPFAKVSVCMLAGTGGETGKPSGPSRDGTVEQQTQQRQKWQGGGGPHPCELLAA